MRGLDAAVAEAAHPANPAAGIVVVLHRLAVHAHDPTRLAAAVVLAVAHRVAAAETSGARWVDTVLSNAKRALDGVCRAVRQAKYARRYLAEAAYRFDRRVRLREMLPRPATALMRCKPCPEPILRAASNFHG